MERLTEKSVGMFRYALKGHKSEVGEFNTYDAFFDYSYAVKKLGEYEDTGLEPEEIAAICAQLEREKLESNLQEVESNEPLTLEELREMDGEPAYFVALHKGFCEWGIVRIVNMSKAWFIAVSGAERAFGDKDNYGKTWIAYRRKPEEQ